ncbi:MerR family transcriptional regulator [Microbacterium sp. SORGH_AS_0862]|uniref:MerR family transcriptional regulator n=1 Tax=Microbacterium sp. SORGH_AS_0862 TaxID=3041789 RepID=UPI00279324B0|nr:type IV toxin-antitoxin system AbiEi family antitoxin domain-containing protein [Microbacterium sp. SORGH_AS_0862]MDQ1206192.1 DNA-binding transcriptional MerR regulator [Microbacterium sp. SORGH_AS_0862]
MSISERSEPVRILTLAQAAKRVGKSERQIRRYIEQGLLEPVAPSIKRYYEQSVVKAEKESRSRVGRPRKTREKNVSNSSA